MVTLDSVRAVVPAVGVGDAVAVVEAFVVVLSLVSYHSSSISESSSVMSSVSDEFVKFVFMRIMMYVFTIERE